VDCTGGRSVLGGGFIVAVESGSAAEITVYDSHATDSDTWSVTGAEDNDADVGNWSITAFAICALVSP
jgi:hypothetical protein